MFKVNNIDKKITSINLVFVSLLITFTIFRAMTWLFYCRFCSFKLIPFTKYLFIVNKREIWEISADVFSVPLLLTFNRDLPTAKT